MCSGVLLRPRTCVVEQRPAKVKSKVTFVDFAYANPAILSSSTFLLVPPWCVCRRVYKCMYSVCRPQQTDVALLRDRMRKCRDVSSSLFRRCLLRYELPPDVNVPVRDHERKGVAGAVDSGFRGTRTE